MIEADLPYTVYVLRSLKDSHLYVGFTSDLPSRLAAHNKGQSPSTAPRRPFQLIFCEQFLSRQDAERRERYLKSSAGKRTLKIMMRQTLLDAGARKEEGKLIVS
jgi:putative endonuclease